MKFHHILGILVYVLWSGLHAASAAESFDLVLPRAPLQSGALLVSRGLGYTVSEDHVNIWELKTGRWLKELTIPEHAPIRTLALQAPWLVALDARGRLWRWKDQQFYMPVQFKHPGFHPRDEHWEIQMSGPWAGCLSDLVSIKKEESGHILAQSAYLQDCRALPEFSVEMGMSLGLKSEGSLRGLFDLWSLEPLDDSKSYNDPSSCYPGIEVEARIPKYPPTSVLYSAGEYGQPMQAPSSKAWFHLGLDQLFRIRHLETGELKAEYILPGGRVTAWALDQQHMAVARPDVLQPNLEIWDWQQQKRLLILNGQLDPADRLKLAGDLLVSVSRRQLCRWNWPRASKGTCLALTPDEMVIGMQQKPVKSPEIEVTLARKSDSVRLSRRVTVSLDGFQESLAQDLLQPWDAYQLNQTVQNPDILISPDQAGSRWLLPQKTLLEQKNLSYPYFGLWLQPSHQQAFSSDGRQFWSLNEPQLSGKRDPCSGSGLSPCYADVKGWWQDWALISLSEDPYAGVQSVTSGSPSASHHLLLNLRTGQRHAFQGFLPYQDIFRHCLENNQIYLLMTRPDQKSSLGKLDLRSGTWQPDWLVAPEKTSWYTCVGGQLLGINEEQVTTMTSLQQPQKILVLNSSNVLPVAIYQQSMFIYTASSKRIASFSLPGQRFGAEINSPDGLALENCHQQGKYLFCSSASQLWKLDLSQPQQGFNQDVSLQFDSSEIAIQIRGGASYLQSQGASPRTVLTYALPTGVFWVSDSGHFYHLGHPEDFPYLVKGNASQDLPAELESREDILRALAGLPDLKPTGLELHFEDSNR